MLYYHGTFKDASRKDLTNLVKIVPEDEIEDPPQIISVAKDLFKRESELMIITVFKKKGRRTEVVATYFRNLFK